MKRISRAARDWVGERRNVVPAVACGVLVPTVLTFRAAKDLLLGRGLKILPFSHVNRSYSNSGRLAQLPNSGNCIPRPRFVKPGPAAQYPRWGRSFGEVHFPKAMYMNQQDNCESVETVLTDVRYWSGEIGLWEEAYARTTSRPGSMTPLRPSACPEPRPRESTGHRYPNIYPFVPRGRLNLSLSLQPKHTPDPSSPMSTQSSSVARITRLMGTRMCRWSHSCRWVLDFGILTGWSNPPITPHKIRVLIPVRRLIRSHPAIASPPLQISHCSDQHTEPARNIPLKVAPSASPSPFSNRDQHFVRFPCHLNGRRGFFIYAVASPLPHSTNKPTTPFATHLDLRSYLKKLS
ncbi:hypothetical protein G7K_2063-t1 [Saitoella complicata NRRL Y-17804]|uniref:Uncharacterized protein n=1 Tax=Saitoella complicata (strain BCRC 22490 / CBS 7301 / JCM 7358 / NBRC 10748 / NRRL Y-17804) TaxID=698492 RepID=A0A0E9NDF3_SAICN|nr:hypothetical protein G7K_2063-t1 [Saitoella complicata NRRL Y-17804]